MNSGKICSKCKVLKSYKEFYTKKDSKDNYQSRCKICSKATVANVYRDLSEEGRKEYNKKVKARIDNDPNKKAKTQAQTSFFRAKALQRLPKWYKSIEQQYVDIYRKAIDLTLETGVKHEVDHIIPLRCSGISGLHIPNNLQIITDVENIVKFDHWDGTYKNDSWKQEIPKIIKYLKAKYKAKK